MISLPRVNRFDSPTFTKDPGTGAKVDNELDRIFNFVNGITTGAFAQALPISLFGQTATATVSNTNAQTSLIGAGVGITTFPPNFFKVGRTILLQASGTYSSKASSAGTLRIFLKLNSTVVINTDIFTLVNNQTDQLWVIYLPVTCRVQGTAGTGLVISNGYLAMYDTTNGMRFFPMSFPTGTNIDTTIAETLDLTAQFGTADTSNKMSTTNLTIISE